MKCERISPKSARGVRRQPQPISAKSAHTDIAHLLTSRWPSGPGRRQLSDTASLITPTRPRTNAHRLAEERMIRWVVATVTQADGLS